MTLREWLGQLPGELGTGVSLSILAATASAVWAGAKVYASAAGITVPVAIAAGAVVFASVIGSWNWILQIHDRSKIRRIAGRPPAPISQRTHDWLFERGFSVRDDPAPNLEFRLVVDNQAGMPVNIFKSRDQPWVTIGARIAVTDTPAFTVDQLSQLDLKASLIQLGVQYEINEINGKPVNVVISRFLWFDESVNRLTLLNAIMDVRRGLSLVAVIARRAAATSIQRENPDD